MIECAQQIDTRAAVIVALLFEGLRTVEVIRIRKQDYEPTTKSLALRGKGRKAWDQRVPLSETAAALVARWLDHVPAGSWAFVGYSNRHITTRTVRRVFVEIRRCAGNYIPGRAAHVARHTYAKEAAAAGRKLSDIRKHLRHKSDAMTLHYVKSSRIIASTSEAEAGKTAGGPSRQE